MEELKKEIRRILLGYIDYRDNCIVAARDSVQMRMLGTFNGTTMARLFGVSVITRRYRIAEEQETEENLSKSEKKKNRKNGDTKKKQQARKLFEDGDSALQNMGRRVFLTSEPERIAVFYASVFYNPAVLLLDLNEEEEAVEVTVVTARTVVSRLNAAHAFWKWSKYIPYDLERIDIPKPEPEENSDGEVAANAPKTLDRDATKEEKKAYKEKKRAFAAAKKQAKQKQKLETKMAKLQAAMNEQSTAFTANSNDKPEETEE